MDHLFNMVVQLICLMSCPDYTQAVGKLRTYTTNLAYLIFFWFES